VDGHRCLLLIMLKDSGQLSQHSGTLIDKTNLEKETRSPSKSFLPKRPFMYKKLCFSFKIIDVYDQQILVDSDALLLQDLLMSATNPSSKWR